MHFLCWGCCERYENNNNVCPQCGAVGERRVHEEVIGGTEKKETPKKGKAGKG